MHSLPLSILDGGGGGGTVDNASVNAAIAEDAAASRTAIGTGQTFDAKNYGATGDGVFLRNGSIAAADQTLVVSGAVFAAGDVGKRIIVRAAGSSVVDSAGNTNYNDLVTTIASVTNETTIELTLAATTTASDSDVCYGTDDTAALQATIDAAHASGGGTVFIPRGIYFIDGAAQDSADNNCILKIPGSLSQQVIEIKGEMPTVNPNYSLVLPSTVVPSYDGTILFRTSAHAGRIIGGDGDGLGAYGDMTRTMLAVKNIKILGKNGAGWKGLGAYDIAWLDAENITVSTWEYLATRMIEPPSGSMGIECPQRGNAAWVNLKNVWVQCFETGITLTEHAMCNTISVQFCKRAVASLSSGYTATIDRLLAQWCACDIYGDTFTPSATTFATITVANYSWESYNTALHGNRWFNRIQHIYDPNGALRLRIFSHCGQVAGVAGLEKLKIDGGARTKIMPRLDWSDEINPLALHPGNAVISGGAYVGFGIAGQAEPIGFGSEGAYSASVPSNGMTLTWADVFVPSGPCILKIVGRKNPAQGIVEWRVGATLLATEDLYTAVSEANAYFEYEFTNLVSGLKDITATINGKNASSSSYNILLSHVYIVRK